MASQHVDMLGVVASTATVIRYSLEHYGRLFIALFAAGRAAAAVYAYLIGAYPFLMAESIWCLIAARRWYNKQIAGAAADTFTITALGWVAKGTSMPQTSEDSLRP